VKPNNGWAGSGDYVAGTAIGSAGGLRKRWLQLPRGNVMTNVAISFVLMILLVSVVESQIVSNYGFKAGTISATETFDYTIKVSNPTSYRWGLDIGGFVECFRVANLSLLTELHYIQKGYSTSLQETTPAQPDGTGRYITIRPRLDYLSIPVLGKVQFDIGGLTPYVFLGPRLDLLLGKTDASLNYSSTDAGAALGGGIQFSIFSAPDFLVEGRFSPSFGNVFQNQNLTVKNRSFEILLGATF
jgi:hypothetical protein